MSDPNRKTQRSFYCRDNLWDLFEVMARDLGCSMDYLLNEAMRHYAQSRNYSLDAAAPPPPPAAPPAPISSAAMPAAMSAPMPAPMPAQMPAQPPPAAPMQSGFVRAAAAPVLGGGDYPRGFEHRTFERLPAAPPPPPAGAPALTMPMNAVPVAAAYQAAGAPSSGQFQAAHLAAAPPAPPRAAPPPPPPKTITAPMPPGFIDLDDSRDDLLVPSPPPPPPPAPAAFDHRHSFSAHPSVPPPAPPAFAGPPAGFDQRPPSFAGQPTAPKVQAPPPQPSGQGQLSLIFNGQRYPITKDKFIIGRASQITDLTIRDGNVSRQHCAVIQRGGQFFIKDLESTNGIEYQGVRIDSKKIDEGDVFNICEYVMRFTFR